MMKLQARRPPGSLKDIFRRSYGGDWFDILPAQLQWFAQDGYEIRAITPFQSSGVRGPMTEPTRQQIEAAALVMNDHGIKIYLPWDCDLDDLERERYDALRLALAAAFSLPNGEQ